MSSTPTGRAIRRLAVDGRYLRDSFGGIGRFAHGLIGAMADAAPETSFLLYYEPAHVSSRYPVTDLLSRTNILGRPWAPPLYSPQEQILWPMILRRDAADLFYSPYFALPVLAPVPLYCTIHDLIFERDARYAGGKWVRFYHRPMIRIALCRARSVLAVSRSTRSDLVAYYGVAPGRVAVVSEAADPHFRYPVPIEDIEDTRNRLGLPERYVLVVGARRPHKNLGVAVRAFASVQPEVPHTLVVVGRPESRYPDDLRDAVAESGGAVRVREIPAVDDDRLPAVYAGADALLMPSLIEGFGLPALEAMACGTPVVVSDRTSLPEVVGDAGVLVDPTDAQSVAGGLRRVLLDRDLAATMSAGGLRRAAAFTWQRAAREALRALVRA